MRRELLKILFANMMPRGITPYDLEMTIRKVIINPNHAEKMIGTLYGRIFKKREEGLDWIDMGLRKR